MSSKNTPPNERLRDTAPPYDGMNEETRKMIKPSTNELELREQIATIIYRTDDDWGGGGYKECLKSADKVLQLIDKAKKQAYDKGFATALAESTLQQLEQQTKEN